MKFILSFLFLLSFSTIQAQTRLLGGDISLLPTYEKAGTKFIDANGKARPLLDIAKDNNGTRLVYASLTTPQMLQQKIKTRVFAKTSTISLRYASRLRKLV